MYTEILSNNTQHKEVILLLRFMIKKVKYTQICK